MRMLFKCLVVVESGFVLGCRFYVVCFCGFSLFFVFVLGSETRTIVKMSALNSAPEWQLAHGHNNDPF